jgi:hypothetical protein
VAISAENNATNRMNSRDIPFSRFSNDLHLLGNNPPATDKLVS